MMPRIASSSSRRPATAALSALLGALGPDASAAAEASVAAGVSTPGRAGAAMAAAVGLVSLMIGGLALRSARGGAARSTTRVGISGVAAVAVGLTGLALATQHLARFTGGFGTGDGRAGAIVAIVAALVGTALGALAVARARRAG